MRAETATHCLQCHRDGGEIKVQASVLKFNVIHRDCLLTNLYKAISDDRKRHLLEAILAWEKSHPESKYGFEAEDIGAKTQELTSLAKLGILGLPYKSRNYTNYKLTSLEFTEEVLAGTVPSEKEVEAIPRDVFDVIVGYDDLKENLIFALEGKRKLNFLLIGPPATAKTLFILCVQKVMGDKAYLATGSRVTAAGLSEVLLDYRPEVLLLDELDKMDMKSYAVLLSLMETGDVLETKHGRHGGIRLNTTVVAACNDTRRLPPELLSRFMEINFRPYEREGFIEICRRWLAREEGVSEELAAYIGEQTWERLGKDVRRAREVARLLQERTKEDADQRIGFLLRYSKRT